MPLTLELKNIKQIFLGIIDYQVVSRNYAKEVESKGHDIRCNFEVEGFSDVGGDFPISIKSKSGDEIRAKYVITCAGLHSDRMAAKSGGEQLPKIVPFRGDYLLMKPEKAHWINGNIYPVPNPKFPFLGVHYTPRMNGDIWLGPNAVLALDREGKLSSISRNNYVIY